MKITSRQVNWFMFIFFAVLILYVLISHAFMKSELVKNGIVINVTITDITFPAKGSPVFEYTFIYNGKKYEQDGASAIEAKSFLIGKTFPAIFSPKTERSELLLTPDNFYDYQLIFPDSLQWLQKYRGN